MVGIILIRKKAFCGQEQDQQIITSGLIGTMYFWLEVLKYFKGEHIRRQGV